MTDLADRVLDKLSLPTEAPDTVDRLYRALRDDDPTEIRSALETLAELRLIWWSRPTGDVALVARPEVGVTD